MEDRLSFSSSPTAKIGRQAVAVPGFGQVPTLLDGENLTPWLPCP
jgi:hypothetical protein